MDNMWQAACKVVESVPFAWFMMFQIIFTLLTPSVTTFQVVFSLLGFVLFAPCLYKYHIKKSIDVYGNSLS